MMAIEASTALILLPFALPICIWVAWNDMKFMKIPNKAVMALFGVFVVMGLFALPFETYLWRFLSLVVVLILGFLANMVRAMGAGDAKFLAAMAPFFDLRDYNTITIIFASVLLAAFFTHRIFRSVPAIRRSFSDWESWERNDFPMGLALGGALAIYLVLGVIAGS